MLILKLICIAVPLALIAFGCIVSYRSSQEGSSDVRGPGEAIGLMIAIAGVAIGMLEAIAISLWHFLVS